MTRSGIAERRPVRRQRVLLSGILVSLDGNTTVDCTIKDFSTEGARITLRDSAVLSGWFYFIHLRERTAYRATVVWRENRETGLKFADKYVVTSKLDPKLGFLKQLWLARAAR